MHLKRRIVTVAMATVCVVGLAAYSVMRVVESNPQITALVVAPVERATNGSIKIGRVSVGFFAIHLRSLSASFPENNIDFTMADLRIGFSPIKLLRTRGNIPLSISSVIMVAPAVAMRLPDSLRGQALPSSIELGLLNSFPVKSIKVQHGRIDLIGNPGSDTILTLAKISGLIWEDPDDIYFEARGALAAPRPNIALSAVISRTGGNHQLSLRCRSAVITRPIGLPYCRMVAGTIDGTLELSCRDTLRLATLESRGALSLKNGRLQLGGADPVFIDSISSSIRFFETRLLLDSLDFAVLGARAHAEGDWDYSARDQCALNLQVSGLYPDRISPNLASVLSGDASTMLTMRLFRKGSHAPWQGNAAIDGVSLLNQPVVRCVVAFHGDSRAVQIDSLAIKTARASLGAAGIIRLSGAQPAYAITVRAALDSLPLPVQGSLTARGWIDGVGSNVQYNLLVGLNGMRQGALQLGTAQVVVNGTATRLTFETSPAPGQIITLSGTCDSLNAPHPYINATASIKDSMVLALVHQALPMIPLKVDSAALSIFVSGRLPVLDADVNVGLKALPLRGNVRFHVHRSDSGAIRWNVSASQLYLSDSLLPLYASGSIDTSKLTLDNGVVGGIINVGGMVTLGTLPQCSLAVYSAAVPLTWLNTRLLGGKAPFNSGYCMVALRLRGSFDNLNSHLELRLRRADIAGIAPLEADIICTQNDSLISVKPFSLVCDNDTILTIDSLSNRNTISCAGRIRSVDLQKLLRSFAEDSKTGVTGTVDGTIHSSPQGFPLLLSLSSSRLQINTFAIDSVAVAAAIDTNGITITSCSARDSTRLSLAATASVPWRTITDNARESDTMSFTVNAKGDFLAAIGHTGLTPVGGTGLGTLNFYCIRVLDEWHVRHGAVSITNGTMTVRPFVVGPVRTASLALNVDDTGAVWFELNGMVGRQPIRIFSMHDLPSGYSPLMIGPLNFGAIQAVTPQGGVELHLPGFMALESKILVDMTAREPFKYFTMSGPLDRFKITGCWILRNGQFTFPFLKTREVKLGLDPFPFVTWEFDVRAGNRNVMYLFDMGVGKERQLIRLVEAYVDPASLCSIRGRYLDKTFKILGSLHTSRGTANYGRVFDRNFNATLEFHPILKPGGGYNNMPYISGSAEAATDKSRFSRIKLTVLTQDVSSNGLAERGRIAYIRTRRAVVPQGGVPIFDGQLFDKKSSTSSDSILNLSFRVSSDGEDVSGSTQRDFYNSTVTQATSSAGAGEILSGFGDQYISNYLLSKVEHNIARIFGLDVLGFETPFVSNYFKNLKNQTASEQTNRWELLNNTGITAGRFFLDDQLFVKAQGKVMATADTLGPIRPEYSVGFEIQPMQYLFIEGNYGMYQDQGSFRMNPSINLQLQVPLQRLNKLLNIK